MTRPNGNDASLLQRKLPYILKSPETLMGTNKPIDKERYVEHCEISVPNIIGSG